MDKDSSRIKGSIIKFNIILIAGLAALFILLHTYTHTLSRNGNWNSSKTALEKGVMGSWSFMLTYRALVKNQLDLGAWHGYQEIFLNKPPQYNKAEIDFSLAENACLVIFFGKNHDTLTAIRISNNHDYDDALLRVVDTRFVQKTSLNLPELNPGWNSIELDLAGNRTTMTLNNDQENSIILPALNYDVILGFRNYEASAIIDNIILSDSDGKTLFRETFQWKPFLLNWFLLLFLAGNILFIAIPVLRRTLLIAAVNISLIVIVLMLFFLLYGRYQYPKEWMINWKAKTTTIQTEDEVLEMSLLNIPGDSAHPLKMLFLGSSQTWGAGATTPESTFISRFEKMVNDSSQHQVICINTGISGVNSSDILRNYRETWLGAEPDICIVNLSLNDAGNPDFRKNIEEIIKINTKSGITTILIPEPVERSLEVSVTNHQIISDLAEQYDLQLVDIQGYINERYDEGFIFWDFVHLTDFGQQLFAEKLHQELKSTVNRKIVDKKNER